MWDGFQQFRQKCHSANLVQFAAFGEFVRQRDNIDSTATVAPESADGFVCRRMVAGVEFVRLQIDLIDCSVEEKQRTENAAFSVQILRW
jgi:hypothetical protein